MIPPATRTRPEPADVSSIILSPEEVKHSSAKGCKIFLSDSDIAQALQSNTSQTATSLTVVASASSDSLSKKRELTTQSPLYSSSLSLKHIVLAILGGVLNSGFFISGGLSIKISGPAGALIAFALSIALVLCVITSLLEVGSSMPADVPYYMYASKMLGKPAGAALAWMFWLAWISGVAYVVVASGLIVQFWLPQVHSSVWCLCTLVACAAIVFFNAKYYSAAETGFTIFKLCGVLAAVVLGAAIAAGTIGGHKHGFENWKANGGPVSGGIMGIVGALIFSNFSVLGAEAAASMAIRSSDPRTKRCVPAVVCGVLAALYITSIFVTGLILPQRSSIWNHTTESADSSSLTHIFQMAGLRPAAHIMNVVLLLTILFDCCSCLYISSVVLQDLASRSLAPRFLRSADPSRASVPSLSVCCACALVMWAMSYIKTNNALAIYVGTVSTSGLLNWAAIAVMQFKLRWSKPPKHSQAATAYQAIGFPLGPVYCLLYVAAFVVGIVCIGIRCMNNLNRHLNQKRVSYYLRNPKTKPAKLAGLIPASLQHSTDLNARIARMSTLRETMRDKLKTQSKADDLTSIGSVAAAIADYLDELHWFVAFYEGHKGSFKDHTGVEFIWKSAIVSKLHDAMNFPRPRMLVRGSSASDGEGSGKSAGGSRYISSRPFKQRRTQSHSIYVELGFTLFSLAVVKSMSAYSRVSTLDTEIECETINAMTPGVRPASKEESDSEIDALKRASAELREAAGVFQYIADSILPHLAGVRLNVPDLTPDIQYMLQMLSLADSDRLSVRVWLRTDKNQKKTPNIPANLLLEIQQRYENAYNSLRTLQNGEYRSVSSDIQYYMRDGQQVILAQAMIYLAQVHSDRQKFGNAVGFMRDAREHLIEVKRRKQSVHTITAEKLLNGPVEALYSLYRRNNDTIGFEAVPSSEDLRARLPSGRSLISKAVEYAPQTGISS
ncbi:hypothetical protein GGI12_001678 [Dipsacomyces acuminosporus]|nr:hypothetical protein GGI12_001678 [Dipsacomyces acuminosporus]